MLDSSCFIDPKILVKIVETNNLLNALSRKDSGIHINDFNGLFNLLQYTDETDRVEAKEASHGLGKSFLETVCAFSNEPNLGGGCILLGVSKNKEGKEPRYIVKGIANPDQMQQQIANQCRQCFNVPLSPVIKVIPHAEGTIILIHIAEVDAHDKPVFMESKGLAKGTYRRIGSTDQLCNRDDFDHIYQLRSKRKYDQNQEDRASFEDFDPQAIKTYRIERQKIKPDAAELRYDDLDLLRALEALTRERGAEYPTIGGLLLFGKEMTLERLFPMRNHIDYLLIEGKEWVSDSERRYTAVEMCKPLITGIPYLLNEIMNTIPQIFAMDPNGLQRKDNPLIPRLVIRESLVNAVMHKDYSVISPIQVIKYSNRIEFRNVGYSLKPHDQIGLPGSMPRNEILSKVFQNIHYAEAKGTGISTMRAEMVKANLSVPLIESSRANNLFVLTLLSHHLFTKEHIEWLSHFKSLNLTNEEARTLIVIRERGAITNVDYRTIHSVDTLTASSHLRKLRDNGLIEQKGSGSATYYVPTLKLLAPDINPKAPDINSKAPDINPAELLPQRLLEQIQKMGKRPDIQTVREVIRQICSIKPFTANEIGILLNRNPEYVRKFYLTPMTESSDLILTIPDNPNHPLQAYKLKVLA